MDRLFLDANVLFSASYRPNAGLLEFWKLSNAVLCSSRYALAEAEINLTGDVQRRRLAKLAANLEFTDAILRQLPAGVFLPEKDRPILLAAIDAQATHLITGDLRHFAPLFGKRIEGVWIMTPSQYLKSRP